MVSDDPFADNDAAKKDVPVRKFENPYDLENYLPPKDRHKLLALEILQFLYKYDRLDSVCIPTESEARQVRIELLAQLLREKLGP